MGMLVEGIWRDREVRTEDGRFVRAQTQFRNWITEDGRPGPPARAASRPRPGATTSTSRSPAPGRTGP